MAKLKTSTPSLPTDIESVDSRFIRRPVKGLSERAQDFLTQPDTVMAIMLMSAILMVILPWTFIYTGFLTAAYYAWAASRKYTLPFKLPMNWGGIDYNSPKPGQPGKYNTGAGILYFGRDEQNNEELWIENGDARRHGFFIGTTGSGKALKMDALILTPIGWMENQDILPGMEVCHPDGGTSKVVSIHRQGKVAGVRLHFADGRTAECSRDHLWHIRTRAKKGKRAPVNIPENEGRIMEACDLGILHGLYKDSMEICVPRPAPHTGVPSDGHMLTRGDALRAAECGMTSLGYMPSTIGTPAERRAFLNDFIRAASPTAIITDFGLRLCNLEHYDAFTIKQLAWSLGGTATTFVNAKDRYDVLFMVDDLTDFHPDAHACRFPHDLGLEIMEIEELEEPAEMSCIKVDREDGLYVMENHITTHNTELLLGVVSQTLMWSSGFLFIDGKGTTEFYARAWTLCKRFGREDDLRVLNFTDPGDDPDAPAGGPSTQSNTLNPFAKGSPDQLMNIVVSLMGDAGSGNDMWKSRAVSLVTAMMMCLCELRDRGEILLNVQTIRDFLFLGKGFDKDKLGGRKIKKLEDVPEDAWEEMRTRAGLIELYLRALNGELSNSAKLAMKGFFDTLPGFTLDKAYNGDNQETKANEQYGFLSMQLTKPLGSLADGYGHIFRTPLGEIDMDDVVLNRRILVVLLPALQKAADEMQNCGKIVVTMAKIMMGNASGFSLQGSRQEIVEAKQTRAPSPFIVVLDEAGYYMVKGIDVMMAQARSLGFQIIVAGQDLSAMKAIDKQIAETAAANASILAVGKTVDGAETVQFVQQLLGKATVSVTSGYTARTTILGGNRWDDRMDASFQEVDKIKIEELQSLKEGQFYFLFDGKLVRAATFYIGGNFAENFSVNKFIKVRGPNDRVPGLDQSLEIDFLDGYVKHVQTMAKGFDMEEVAEEPRDSLTQIKGIKDLALASSKSPSPKKTHSAWLAGILGVIGLDEAEASDVEDDGDDEDNNDGWKAQIGGDPRMAGRHRPSPMPDFDDDGMRRPSRPGLGERRRPGMNVDRKGPALKTPSTIPSTLSESLKRASSSESVKDRHSGLVGLLAQESKAVQEAKDAGSITDLEAHMPDAKKETIGSMFTVMAKQMSRMERMLVSELAEGNIGAEIMQRAISINPMPLPGTEAEEYINSRINSLEEQFQEG